VLDCFERAGEAGAVNRKQIQDAFFIVLLVGLSVAFIRLLSPYLVAIAVAVILALLLRHPLNWLLQRGVPRGAATMLIMVALLVFGSVPLILFGILLTSELEEGVRTIRSEWPKLLAWAQERLPGVQALVEQYQLEQRISDLLGNAASQVLSLSQAALSSIAAGIVRAVVVVFLVIYLLLEGEKLVERLYRLLPLDRTHTDELMQHAARTLDATVLGTLFIGVLEGTFGGLLFAVFGFPSATLWGLIMVIVSVLPLLGINVVIVPAGVVAIIMGDTGRGVGLIVVGVAGAVISQNVLRPKLVGDRSGLHPALVLVATLGGLAWMGLIGFVIGPMVATLATIAWEQFANRNENNSA
jgi:predicted PurR-regulated permease PerM